MSAKNPKRPKKQKKRPTAAKKRRPQGRSQRRPRSTAPRPRRAGGLAAPEAADESLADEWPEEAWADHADHDEWVVDEPVAEEPVAKEAEEELADEPEAGDPWLEEFFAAHPATPVPPLPARPRRRVSAAALGRTLVVLLVMAGLAAVVVRHQRQGGSDAGTLTARTPYSAPVALAPGDAYVRSTVLPDGRLRVTHWLRTRRGETTLTLRVPQVAGLAPGTLTVSHLLVVADDQRVFVPTSVTGDEQTLVLPEAHRILVRYLLTGAVQRSDHPPGRALARVVAIEASTGEPTTATTTTLNGARVLAMACSRPRPGALPSPCGSDRDGSWVVGLTGRRARDLVTAQLDLG